MLKTCASCEWIYQEDADCPKCGFVSYGARYVYGQKAYRYATTQQPWLDKKLKSYRDKLLKEVRDTNPIRKKEKDNFLFE